MKRHLQRWLLACLILGLLPLVALSYFFVGIPTKSLDTRYGVTWSTRHAASYGLLPQETLQSILDDLGVRRFRIPAYWDLIEKEPGQFSFDELVKQLDEIAKRGGKATIVVGATQPRWPECWLPTWIKDSMPTEREHAQRRYIERTVQEFMRHPALARWQVENEPTLKTFGSCKNQRLDFIASEIALIREIETKAFLPTQRHGIVTTDSGELSTWTSFAGWTDGRGISIYRIVLAPASFLFRYDFLPPFFYARKAALVERMTGPVFVSEFQMEPWADRDLIRVPFEEQSLSMNEIRMKDHLWVAERTRLPEVYFWGIEWWAWMKVKQGHPEYWEEMKRFFARHPSS